ncbi:hypothetical protein C1645_739199 [Glomus cerebriforme]|uniref:Uncharacterized protein n=1 Tax=Glomus cerebriforme TaxID=658196 RepID=A0A397SSK1_9GLOM|nr:hypothetical protein C1645_739199 [Glomus cerebriforme]
MNSIKNFTNVEEWKNPKYLDYDNTFNIIEETLIAFRDYNTNFSINIDEIKKQEFIFYQLVKEEIALESYRFSLYAADVIVYINMLMEESIKSIDLLEVLQSLLSDAKIRLDFVENLNNKYILNNFKMIKPIHEYTKHGFKDPNMKYNCLAPFFWFLNFIPSIQWNRSSLNQPLLSDENENQSNVEVTFQELMFKYKKGLNIICEIKQFWENQIEIINKFIDIFDKGFKGTKEICSSQKDGLDIRNKWEKEKKCSEIFYHKIRNLLI